MLVLYYSAVIAIFCVHHLKHNAKFGTSNFLNKSLLVYFVVD